MAAIVGEEGANREINYGKYRSLTTVDDDKNTILRWRKTWGHLTSKRLP